MKELRAEANVAKVSEAAYKKGAVVIRKHFEDLQKNMANAAKMAVNTGKSEEQTIVEAAHSAYMHGEHEDAAKLMRQAAAFARGSVAVIQRRIAYVRDADERQKLAEEAAEYEDRAQTYDDLAKSDSYLEDHQADTARMWRVVAASLGKQQMVRPSNAVGKTETPMKSKEQMLVEAAHNEYVSGKYENAANHMRQAAASARQSAAATKELMEHAMNADERQKLSEEAAEFEDRAQTYDELAKSDSYIAEHRAETARIWRVVAASLGNTNATHTASKQTVAVASNTNTMTSLQSQLPPSRFPQHQQP